MGLDPWKASHCYKIQSAHFPWATEDSMNCSIPSSSLATGLGSRTHCGCHILCLLKSLTAVLGDSKVIHGLFKCQRVGTTNPQVVQGSTVAFMY